jgi:MYXO-CTERM domain-containing protein
MLLALGAAAIAAKADAASLAVSADKLTYNVGETITLTVVGDDQGYFVKGGIFGQLDYSGALVDNGSRSQLQLVGEYGNWIKGTLAQADNGTSAHSYAFNQIVGYYAQSAINLPADNPLSTVTLIAEAVGFVNVNWNTTGFTALDFFGLTNAPGTSFTIVPEPAPPMLLTVGLLGLAGWRRRRH